MFFPQLLIECSQFYRLLDNHAQQFRQGFVDIIDDMALGKPVCRRSNTDGSRPRKRLDQAINILGEIPQDSRRQDTFAALVLNRVRKVFHGGILPKLQVIAQEKIG